MTQAPLHSEQSVAGLDIESRVYDGIMSHLELLDYQTYKMGGGNQLSRSPTSTTIGLSDNSIC